MLSWFVDKEPPQPNPTTAIQAPPCASQTGASTGAIQIAGTDALAQLPFFITACDYTLIGEELYAASAYISKQPLLLGAIKGEDWGKLTIAVILIIASIIGLITKFPILSLFS